MAHMDPSPFESVPEDIEDRFTHYEETRGFSPNSIQTMARRPEIVHACIQLNEVVVYGADYARRIYVDDREFPDTATSSSLGFSRGE